MNPQNSQNLDEFGKSSQTPFLVRPYDQVQEEFVGIAGATQSGIFPDVFSGGKKGGNNVKSTISEPVPQVFKDDGFGKLIALNEQLRVMSIQQEQLEKVRDHPAGKILHNIGSKKAKSVVNELFQAFGSQLWPFEWQVNARPKQVPPVFDCEFTLTELKIPGYEVIRNVIFKVSDHTKGEAVDRASCTALCWLQDKGFLPAGNYSEAWRAKKSDIEPEIRKVEGIISQTSLAPAISYVRQVQQDYERSEAVEEYMDVEKLALPFTPVLEEMEAALGYRFGKKNILRQACHHASCGQVNWKKLCTLGAAALNYIVVLLLEEAHPELEPSTLTTRKNEILKREKFEEFASKLGLSKYMVVQYKFAQKQPSAAMLVEMFEAIVGAIDRDGGPHQSRAFVKRLLNL